MKRTLTGGGVAAIVAALMLPTVALVAGTMTPAAAQTTQLTDDEACDLTPRDGSWSMGLNTTDNEMSFNHYVEQTDEFVPITDLVPGAVAACANRLEEGHSDGTWFRVAVYQLPSVEEARAAEGSLRAYLGTYAALGVLPDAGAAGGSASLADFGGRGVALAGVGPFLVIGSYDGYDNIQEYDVILAERMAESVANIETLLPDATPQTDQSGEEYGVIERDGNIYLVSPPDGPLRISRGDLPEWVRDHLATVGDNYARVGPPGTIATGDDQILLDGRPVARIGDTTESGGTILEGSAIIFVNGVPAATVGSFVVDPIVFGGTLPAIGGPILGYADCDDPANLKKTWMGTICVANYPDPIGFLEEAARRGDVRIYASDYGAFRIGDAVLIGNDEATVESAIVADKGSLVLDRPLLRDHPAGTAVVRIPDEHAHYVPAPGVEIASADADEGSGSAMPAVLVVVLLGAGAVAAGLFFSRRRSPHPVTAPPPPPAPPPSPLPAPSPLPPPPPPPLD